MSKTSDRVWNDRAVETVIGRMLQVGVVLAATIVCIGGVLFLFRHGTEPSDHRRFHGEPSEFTSLAGVAQAAWQGQGRGIVQFGMLLLVLTPIARVVFSVYAFARERDWLYVAITLIVLGVLLYGLIDASG